jgi:hypothetical protein
MRLKIRIGDVNGAVEVINPKTCEFVEGIVRVGFDSAMGVRSKVTIEIAMPYVDLEFVPDELLRERLGIPCNKEETKN